MAALSSDAKKHFLIAIAILAVSKLVLSIFFSSDHIHQLFLPFLKDWAELGGNPWARAFAAGKMDMFPYPPLMLWIHGFLPWITGLHDPQGLGARIVLRLPTLMADFAICWMLLRLFPGKFRDVFLLFAASPILCFAGYIHGQLDVIPTALVLAAMIKLMRGHDIRAGLLLGAALLCKLHVLAVLPLFAIYLYRHRGLGRALLVTGGSLALYALAILPFLGEPGFLELVHFNPRQSLILSSAISIGKNQLYLAPLAGILICIRFFLCRRLSHDLLTDFTGLLFASFLLLGSPSPGWFLWYLPFFCLFLIQKGESQARSRKIYGALQVVYVLYFLSLKQDLSLVLFLGNPVLLPYSSPATTDFLFTLLWALVLMSVYTLLKFGILGKRHSSQRNSSVLIGVAGDSGAGKSTVVRDLKEVLGTRLLYLEGDADHRWERHHQQWSRYTHLDPKANHLHRQLHDLKSLKAGQSVLRGEYDHETGKFTAPHKILPRDFTLICGLHPFYLPNMRRLLDLKIYIDTEEELRRDWKIQRDIQSRGYSQEKILEQIQSRMPDARRYIHPQKEYADIIIRYYREPSLEGNHQILLQIQFEASVHLEPLLDLMRMQDLEFEWDYLDNLQHQYIRLLQEPENLDYQVWASYLIEDLQLFAEQDLKFEGGYRGFVQLLCLLVLNETMEQESA